VPTPRPGSGEPQGRCPAVAHDAAGGVQEGVAQPLGLALGQLALQAQAPGPGEQILGHEHDLDPGGVGGEVEE
jgi:hypothetical protein